MKRILLNINRFSHGRRGTTPKAAILFLTKLLRKHTVCSVQFSATTTTTTNSTVSPLGIGIVEKYVISSSPPDGGGRGQKKKFSTCDWKEKAFNGFMMLKVVKLTFWWTQVDVMKLLASIIEKDRDADCLHDRKYFVLMYPYDMLRKMAIFDVFKSKLYGNRLIVILRQSWTLNTKE